MSPKPRKRLGEILIERNQLLPEQLEAALEGQKRTEKRLGQVLIDMGFLSHDEVMAAISEQTGVPHVWLQRGLVDPKVLRILPKEKAQANCVIPMFKVGNALTLGMADFSDLLAVDDVESITGCTVQPVQCRRADVETAIRD